MVNPFPKIRHFLSETLGEINKSVWPTWTELKDSTVVVLSASLLLGGYIALMDFSVYNVILLLTRIVRPG